jgi:hypothetical protein
MEGSTEGSLTFASLVQADDDTIGLLGYALYKQNKRDWLTSFFKEQGREATSGELLAYHLGERSPRRHLTYRRLAVDILARDPGGREGRVVGNNAVRPGAMNGAATLVDAFGRGRSMSQSAQMRFRSRSGTGRKFAKLSGESPHPPRNGTFALPSTNAGESLGTLGVPRLLCV